MRKLLAQARDRQCSFEHQMTKIGSHSTSRARQSRCLSTLLLEAMEKTLKLRKTAEEINFQGNELAHRLNRLVN